MSQLRPFGIELEYECGHRVIDHDKRLSFLQKAGLMATDGRAPPPREAHDVAAALAGAGYLARAVPRGNKQTALWRVFADPSGGIEVASSIQYDEGGLQRVREALPVLAGAGCTTAEGLGLHVHVAASDLRLREVKAVARLAAHLDPLLVGLLTPVRRETCEGGWVRDYLDGVEAARTLDGAIDAQPNRRYTWNIKSLRAYGTIELRLPGTTLDPDALELWARVAQGVVHEGRRLRVDPAADPLGTLLGLRAVRPVARWLMGTVRGAG